jgi:ATP-dependent exoDNAse (exonuclease V) alpha subunit
MELTEEQNIVIEYLGAFIKDQNATGYKVLHGLAGTGKTFTMAELHKRFPRTYMATYTAKAADVLRRRAGSEVFTTHKLFHRFKGNVRDEKDPDKMNPVFEPLGIDMTGCTVIIDECSMIGKRHADEIMLSGVKIIATGDPGQLPPVMDEQFFTDPDVSLITIHRQALESPIIRQAHNIRNNGRYEADTDKFQVKSSASRADMVESEMLLCYQNSTRKKLNYRRRQHVGIENKPLQAGEPVMALKNNYELGIYNGAIYEVLEDLRWNSDEIILDIDGIPVSVDYPTIEDMDKFFDQRRYQDWYTPFAIGYAATIHKSQGSQWDSVLIIDECVGSEWRQLMYTGVTRAVDSVKIIK